MLSIFIKRLILPALFIQLLIPQMGYADKLQTPSSPTLPVLPQVQVEATHIAPTTGTTIIDKEMIENLPTRNGSVNEIISTVPGVQYGETTLSSFTAGEITPPVVSISGSRFYDNNYTIDGIDNNSPLDPAFSDYNKQSKLPGHPQIHFVSPQLIDQVTVYNSNIPAEFGGFTGGQVETETINPDEDFWGEINYRTTSHKWTKFHIDPYNEEGFYSATDPTKQPEFKKHDFGVILNIPLDEKTGLITSYHHLYSQIPLINLNSKETQQRRQEVFYLKLNHELNSTNQLSLTTLYTPTTSSYFIPNGKDSRYTVDRQNFSLIMNLKSSLKTGQLETTIDYSQQKTFRHSPLHKYLWSTATDSVDWSDGTYASEGGSGNLSTGQKRLSFHTNMDFNTIQLEQTSHQIKMGFEGTTSSQSYQRPQTSYYYYFPKTSLPIICNPEDIACIDGEQYLVWRTKYTRADVNAKIIDVAAYIQDSIVWRRLELFPGIRISYDDFTHLSNIAPRFSASLDIFGNKRTILFGGKNRYYSGTLLTHALYKQIITVNQKRDDNISEWVDKSLPFTPISYLYAESKVKTPYSDELTVGIIQKLLGGEFKLQYLEKSSQDEFTRRKIDNPRPEADIYLLNNDGRSKHKSYQVSWQRSWKKHFLEINGTWQETATSNNDYTATVNEDDLMETVWYKGKELNYYEIPRNDFNRPFIGNLTYIGQLPYGFTFTNITKYRGAYWKIDKTGKTQPSSIYPGEDSDVYEKRKEKDSIIFDWKISYTIPQFRQYQAIISLDIYNVFNRRTGVPEPRHQTIYDYELGRQFWAGLEFRF